MTASALTERGYSPRGTAGARHAHLLQGRVARGERLPARRAADRRGRRRPRAGHRAAPDDRGRAGLAGGDHAEEPCRDDPRGSAAEARGDRLEGRSGDARDLQQPLHVDRRADGRDAAEHRLFGQHQGAARLLLRGVRPARRPRRQRAAHAGASGLDGPFGRDDHQGQRRPHSARRRLCAQRPLQRRHASARHHRLHAGVRRQGRDPSLLGRLARPSRRHRRDRAGLDVAARDHDPRGGGLYRQFPAGRARPFPRARADRAPDRVPMAGAQPGPERQRLEGADRRQRQGRPRASPHGRAFRSRYGRGLYGPRAGQRRGERAPGDRPARRQRGGIGLRPGRGDQGQDHGRPGPPRGDRRLHRNLAAAAEQLQRAGAR